MTRSILTILRIKKEVQFASLLFFPLVPQGIAVFRSCRGGVAVFARAAGLFSSARAAGASPSSARAAGLFSSARAAETFFPLVPRGHVLSSSEKKGRKDSL